MKSQDYELKADTRDPTDEISKAIVPIKDKRTDVKIRGRDHCKRKKKAKVKKGKEGRACSNELEGLISIWPLAMRKGVRPAGGGLACPCGKALGSDTLHHQNPVSNAVNKDKVKKGTSPLRDEGQGWPKFEKELRGRGGGNC